MARDTSKHRGERSEGRTPPRTPPEAHSDAPQREAERIAEGTGPRVPSREERSQGTSAEAPETIGPGRQADDPGRPR